MTDERKVAEKVAVLVVKTAVLTDEKRAASMVSLRAV